MSHEAANNSEVEFFKNGIGKIFNDSNNDRCGTDNLRTKLGNLLLSQMNEQIPSILESLRKLNSDSYLKYKTFNEVIEKANVIM